MIINTINGLDRVPQVYRKTALALGMGPAATLFRIVVPAALGYMWAKSPDQVFVLGAGMAVFAFLLVCLIPRHPGPGNETVFSRGVPVAAE